ncbi:MAG TPA: rod shape-determining protein RodA [Acidimicrobiales bacterium]|jgi:rod shape determining protein RodA|nr:rod shape-determining protein RodA [Acidimicrobiales bacterium]
MARTTLDLSRIPSRERQLRTPSERGRRRDESLFRDRAPAAWRHVDLVLLMCTAAVSALGALMILSSTRGTDPDVYDLSFLRKQVFFLVMGVIGMVLVTLVDYRRLRDFAWLPYAVGLVLLALVVSPLGTEQRGTQAWFQLGSFQLQPAELAKVTVVLAVAALLAGSEVPLRVHRVGLTLLVFGVPTALIMLQPDLGTALVFVAIATGMLLIAGARARHVVVLTAVGVIAVVGVLTSDVLETYQRDRLTGFLDQDGTDLQAEAYNLDQSKAAIASGSTSGKGLFEGTQTRLGFVPEQHTDFIFTAVGEELGFVGSATVLGLLALMCLRIWRTAQIAHDRLGMLICVGVLSMLVFQIFQNVGMTMGIMPITGITLPFMSYGGSSVLASWLAIGLVLNVHMRRFG